MVNKSTLLLALISAAAATSTTMNVGAQQHHLRRLETEGTNPRSNEDDPMPVDVETPQPQPPAEPSHTKAPETTPNGDKEASSETQQPPAEPSGSNPGVLTKTKRSPGVLSTLGLEAASSEYSTDHLYDLVLTPPPAP